MVPSVSLHACSVVYAAASGVDGSVRVPRPLKRAPPLPTGTIHPTVIGNLHRWRAMSEYLCTPALSPAACPVGVQCLNTVAHLLCHRNRAVLPRNDYGPLRTHHVGRLRTAWRFASVGKGGAHAVGGGHGRSGVPRRPESRSDSIPGCRKGPHESRSNSLHHQT